MNNIQGPPTTINGTTATGTTESSTPMNNITSAASPPSSSVPLPLPPPPGQKSNDIRTYLESNPQQMKRMQTIETFIQQSKESPTKKQQSSSSTNNSATDSHSPTPSTSTSVPPDTDTASSKISAKIPDVTEDMAVQAYHDYIVQYYQDMAKKAGSNFSMGALKQPPRNSAQQATYNEFLQLLVENIEYLIANNIVLVPGSEAFNNINPAPFSIDNGNAHIYCLLELLKIGHTGNGLERLKEYIKQLREQGIIGPNEEPTIVSCIDVENIPEDIQRESARLHLEGLAKFLPDELPTTEYEALLVEMFGLPLPAVYYIWSLVKSIDECPIYGGAIEIQSYWRRFELNGWESGLQEYLRRRGASIHQESIMHEFVNGNFLGCYLSRRLHAKEDVDTLLGKFSPPTRSHIMSTAISA